ncbi:hypothetical protein GCM10022399_19590 [Terrabacter ginsenosidimutans]|uniref:Uncharacterized protein n=1 Tax=Terrabacter ginsenosidimutans TaxID=490575 RepID=A0ABP7DDK3_9MICO
MLAPAPRTGPNASGAERVWRGKHAPKGADVPTPANPACLTVAILQINEMEGVCLKPRVTS